MTDIYFNQESIFSNTLSNSVKTEVQFLAHLSKTDALVFENNTENETSYI